MANRTLITLTLQKHIEHENDDEYDTELSNMVEELEKNGFSVDLTDEEDVSEEENDNWLKEAD